MLRFQLCLSVCSHLSESGRLAYDGNKFLLPPTTQLRKDNVFTPVCHSIHRGEVCHTLWADTPLIRHPPLRSACWDTVNKREVRILLECNLGPSIILPIHFQDPPFVFRNASDSCRGNACFYGYSIDLLARVAADLGFRYTLYEVPDGRYGSLNEFTRQWDGMVNELIPGKDGLAVSSVSLDIL